MSETATPPWLGRLPNGWRTERLKLNATIRNSNVDKKTYGGGIPVRLCNYTDVYYNEYITDDMSLMAATATPQERHRFHLEPGDVIITKDSETWDDIGIPACVVEELNNVVCGYHLTMMRPDSNLDGRFLMRSLMASGIKEQFHLGANGVTRFGIGLQDIKDTWIPVPPIETQRRIAAFLDRKTAAIDALIAKKQRLITLLQEKRQALITHAVTKGLRPDVPMKDSGVPWIGEIPAHWEADKIFRLTTRIGDGLHGTPTYEEGTGLFFMNGNNIREGRIVLDGYAREVPSSEYKRHYIPINTSTVFLSINGTIGNAAIYLNEPVILSKSVAYMNCGKQLLPSYLEAFFSSQCAPHYYDLLSTGTTISNLSLDAIRQLKIPLPCLKEQHAIVDFTSKTSKQLDESVNASLKSIEKLLEYRQALISAAVTGQMPIDGENA